MNIFLELQFRNLCHLFFLSRSFFFLQKKESKILRFKKKRIRTSHTVPVTSWESPHLAPWSIDEATGASSYSCVPEPDRFSCRRRPVLLGRKCNFSEASSTPPCQKVEPLVVDTLEIDNAAYCMPKRGSIVVSPERGSGLLSPQRRIFVICLSLSVQTLDVRFLHLPTSRSRTPWSTMGWIRSSANTSADSQVTHTPLAPHISSILELGGVFVCVFMAEAFSNISRVSGDLADPVLLPSPAQKEYALQRHNKDSSLT